MIKNYIIVGEMTNNETALYWGNNWEWIEDFDKSQKWTKDVLNLELPVGAVGCMELTEFDWQILKNKYTLLYEILRNLR